MCPTVESVLFAALIKTLLIRDRSSCAYSRCGRTDRGVHAAGNYVSLQLRLRPGAKSADGSTALPEHYDYVTMLNGVLPQDVRIMAVAQVPNCFDARFSCLYRIYKYFFVLEGEDLDCMRSAARYFVGDHDFRNFCKMDIEHTTNFRRRILSIDISKVDDSGSCVATITGLSFLWHQVRNMMAVLLLVGQGLEEPEVVQALLDVEKYPRKPIYDLADGSGLVLFDCVFEGLHMESAVSASSQAFSQMLAQSKRMTQVLICLNSASGSQKLRNPKEKAKYKPLLQRALCPSLEEKLETLGSKRRRLENDPAAHQGIEVDE